MHADNTRGPSPIGLGPLCSVYELRCLVSQLNVVLVLLLSQADIDRVRLVLAAQIGADVAVRAQRMRLGLWVDDYAARSTIISTLSPSKYACPSFASTKSSAFGCSESVVASIQSAM